MTRHARPLQIGLKAGDTPTWLTITGFDTGPLANARRQFDDRSPVVVAQGRLGGNMGAIEREIDRYCVQPGQALSYMPGWKTWTDARDAARKRLGDKFDIKRFHDAGLMSGTMPLDVLSKVLADV